MASARRGESSDDSSGSDRDDTVAHADVELSAEDRRAMLEAMGISTARASCGNSSATTAAATPARLSAAAAAVPVSVYRAGSLTYDSAPPVLSFFCVVGFMRAATSLFSASTPCTRCTMGQQSKRTTDGNQWGGTGWRRDRQAEAGRTSSLVNVPRQLAPLRTGLGAARAHVDARSSRK